MNKNSALSLAGIIFGIVSLVHLVRIYFAIDITISSYIIPMWVSWVAFVVALILSFLMFSARKKHMK